MTLLYPVVSDSDGSTPPSDAELILAVRTGDRHAYGVLYERHLAAARAQARQLARSSADADDLVAEAFAKVFAILQGGGGPDSAFRAYLMTALRNAFYQRMRQDRRLELTDDMTRHDEGIPWSDPVAAELESSLAARAFSTLPARWQTVLWQSEVERQSTAEIGARLGLRPSAVAALAYRAREGLRQAYLQAHLADHPDESCRPTVHRLGGWTRGRLAAGDTALVREHLAHCDRCRGLAAELADVNDGLGGLLAPLAAAGYACGAVSAGSVGAVASGPAVGPTVASGAAAGAAGGAAVGASGSGSAVGSALGWLLGTHAGQAVAALTAVVVGGTAVAAGTGAVGPDHRAATAAATAAAGSGRPVSPGADPGRVDFRQLVPGTHDKPSGKQPSAKSRIGKDPGDKPAGTQSAGQSAGRSAGRAPSGTASGGAASGGAGPTGEPAGTPSAGRSAGRAPSGTPAGTQSTGRSAGRAPSGTPSTGKGPTGEPAGTVSTGRAAGEKSNGTGRTGTPRPAPPAAELPTAAAEPTRGRTAPVRSAKKEPARAETRAEPAVPGRSAGL